MSGFERGLCVDTHSPVDYPHPRFSHRSLCHNLPFSQSTFGTEGIFSCYPVPDFPENTVHQHELLRLVTLVDDILQRPPGNNENRRTREVGNRK